MEIYLLLAVLYGLVLGLLDRLRETCDFYTWAVAVIEYFNISNIPVIAWIFSIDEYEDKRLINYFWRDGYHAFKFFFFVWLFAGQAALTAFIILGLIVGFAEFDTIYLIIATGGGFGFMQIIYNQMIKNLIKEYEINFKVIQAYLDMIDSYYENACRQGV